METKIIKTVKGATMEAMFESCKILSVRYYKALNLESEENYNPEKRYKYEINIRHAENTSANILFEEARFQIENLTAQ